jgi:membrane-bound serine protease (ClpP class)
MELLLNPNIAYLILLGAALLVMMAIISPGTGLLEVMALFAILLSGYSIYNLSSNWWALAILALSIVPFIFAIQKPRRELFLAFAILLLVLGSLFMFPRSGGQSGVSPLVAILGSAGVTGLLWIAVRKSMEAAHAQPSHDLDRLIGKVGQAVTNVNSEGSAQVSGELWSARSENPIPAGSQIRVLRREGFILIVEKK